MLRRSPLPFKGLKIFVIQNLHAKYHLLKTKFWSACNIHNWLWPSIIYVCNVKQKALIALIDPYNICIIQKCTPETNKDDKRYLVWITRKVFDVRDNYRFTQPVTEILLYMYVLRQRNKYELIFLWERAMSNGWITEVKFWCSSNVVTLKIWSRHRHRIQSSPSFYVL